MAYRINITKMASEVVERLGLGPDREWIAIYPLRTAYMVDDAAGPRVRKHPIGAYTEDGELLSDFQIVDRYSPDAIEESARSQRGCYGPTTTRLVAEIPVTQYSKEV